MSMIIPSENKLVTCPYDAAHKVKESRLQLHITKCKRNHLDTLTKTKTCPFNATHVLPAGEYDHHLSNCPDRGALDRQLAQSVNKNNPFKGRTDVPQYSEPIQLDEVWDIDTPSTVQLPQPPPGAVLQPSEFATPSEKREFYRSLHELPSEPKSKTSVTAKAPPALPRQPKNPSNAENFMKPNPKVIENLGLGRGKPPRLAANFTNVESSENSTYSSIVSNMGNLGLGRGRPSQPNNGPVPIFDDDDDFPVLGCGRGIVHQSVRTPGARPKNFYK